ncbi:MAG: outer membrane beta-barrel protein [Bacteroidetes bacterium]|nr:outer membrane beta-barrel protein [Bacteroidota bacterium]
MPRYLLAIFLLFLSLSLRAQSWEIGGTVGAAGYMGDLNPNNPLKPSGIAFGAFGQRNFDGYWSLKLQYMFGQIQASDANSSDPQFRQRNLSFHTQLNEIAAIGEFNLFKYIPEAGQNRFTPFIYFGVGIVGYNPQAVYQGHTYDLRPLTTEGESKPYSSAALTVPYGVGFKYNFSGKWNFIADIGYRNPYTDYLDDVSKNYAPKSSFTNPIAQALSDRSGENTGVYIGAPGTQRGDMRPHDTYWFVGLTISFTIVSTKCYY